MTKIKVQKRNVGAMQMRAFIVPNSINKEERTFDVTFATDTPVLRTTFWSDPFYEILSFAPGAVRMGRLENGAPLLDNHASYGSVRTNNLGRVEKAWIENARQGGATIKLSRSEDKIWNDIQDGILGNVSVGYNVYEYRSVEKDGEYPEYTATDWEPFEISLTMIPADVNAQTRSAGVDSDTHTVKIKKTMNKNLRRIADTGKEPAGGATPNPAPTGEATPTGETRSDDPDAGAAHTVAERTRVKNIRSLCRTHSMDDEFVDAQIDGGFTLDAVRSAILTKLADGQSTAQTRGSGVTLVVDERDKKRTAMTEGLLLRAGYHNIDSTFKPEGNNEYRNMSLLDLAKECCDLSGIQHRGMTNREIAQAAMYAHSRASSGALGTSDFTYIMANTVNRTLRAAYDLAPRTFQPFCRASTIKDFRPVTRTLITNLADVLEKVPEYGEYKATKVTDGGETYFLSKYGRKISLSWEAIINDDLDAFSRLPQAIANAAAQTQSNIVWNDVFLGSGVMSDNVVLFHANHNNLAGSGATISLTTLAAARQALRTQKDPAGNFLNLNPQYLIVGPALEQVALQFMSTNYVATKSGDINVYQGSMTIIVEPRITGNAWFVACPPSQIDTIEYAFLEGEGELFTEQRVGWEVDGMEMKARMVFAAKAIDFRGLYKNPGA